MKTVFILLLMTVALNAQEEENQQIYGLLLNKHLESAEDISEHSTDYDSILKELGILGKKGLITAKAKREIEKVLGMKRPKDTLVFSTEYAPETKALKDLKDLGIITAKEKRKIERALMTGYLMPSPELKRYFESVREISPVAKDESYMKRYFSKPIDLGAGKKVIFSITSIKSKKYKGGKAMGCAIITFFSKNGENWSIKNVICYEVY